MIWASFLNNLPGLSDLTCKIQGNPSHPPNWHELNYAKPWQNAWHTADGTCAEFLIKRTEAYLCTPSLSHRAKHCEGGGAEVAGERAEPLRPLLAADSQNAATSRPADSGSLSRDPQLSGGNKRPKRPGIKDREASRLEESR